MEDMSIIAQTLEWRIEARRARALAIENENPEEAATLRVLACQDERELKAARKALETARTVRLAIRRCIEALSALPERLTGPQAAIALRHLEDAENRLRG